MIGVHESSNKLVNCWTLNGDNPLVGYWTLPAVILHQLDCSKDSVVHMTIAVTSVLVGV